MNDNNPQVYVADLAAYNAGSLTGKWFTPTDYADADDFAEAVTDYLSKMGREEWAIHDTDGFYLVNVGVHPSLDWVYRVAAGIAEHGPAFAYWVSEVMGEHMSAEDLSDEAFEGAYLGNYDFPADYAAERVRGTHGGLVDFDAWPFALIDWDQAWRELEQERYRAFSDGSGNGVYIFGPA
jgi:antirestriction protein